MVCSMSQSPSPNIADGLRDIKDLATDLTSELGRVGVDMSRSAYTLTVAIRDQATALLARLDKQDRPE